MHLCGQSATSQGLSRLINSKRYMTTTPAKARLSSARVRPRPGEFVRSPLRSPESRPKLVSAEHALAKSPRAASAPRHLRVTERPVRVVGRGTRTRLHAGDEVALARRAKVHPGPGRYASVAAMPPSTGMTAPVMYVARSEHRNEASSATSSGWPPRLSAVPCTTCGFRSAAPGPPAISVSMKPGQIAMARMSWVPYSTAAALVNAMTPAFAAEYTLTGDGLKALRPTVADQLTMTPPPVASIVLMPCLVPCQTPRRSASMTRS